MLPVSARPLVEVTPVSRPENSDGCGIFVLQLRCSALKRADAGRIMEGLNLVSAIRVRDGVDSVRNRATALPRQLPENASFSARVTYILGMGPRARY